MADNTQLNPGVGGDLVATDDVASGVAAGAKVQRVKVGYGPDNAYSDADFPSPLPVVHAALAGGAIAQGLVPGSALVHVAGGSLVVSTSLSDLYGGGGTYPWPTAALPLRIRAGGNAADTALGSGAREVTVAFLDANDALVIETLATAGASASAPTSASARRIVGAWVSECGTYTGSNTGTIIIENTGTALLAQIDPTFGSSQLTMYSVPTGKTAYLLRYAANVAGTVRVDLTMWQRQRNDDVAAPFASKRLVQRAYGVTGSIARELTSYPMFPEKTDLWWSAQALSGATGVSVTYDLLVVDN